MDQCSHQWELRIANKRYESGGDQDYSYVTVTVEFEEECIKCLERRLPPSASTNEEKK